MTKTTKSQRVAKVKRALKKVVGYRDLPEAESTPSGEVFEALKVVMHGSSVVGAQLKDETVVLFSNNGVAVMDLEGVVGGYNINALKASGVLCALGVVSEEDDDAFHSWWFSLSQRQETQRNLDDARRIAADHGYQLTKAMKK